MFSKSASSLIALAPTLALMMASSGRAEISFSRDILPILSDTCFHCHGPDKAKQYPKSQPLSLESLDGATKDRGGYAAIVPHDPVNSELIARILSDDPDEVMPPPDSNRSISNKQKELLREWIAEGAKYEKHWAFVPPVKAPLPEVSSPLWPRNPVDQFILAALDGEVLKPNPESDREILIRRATLTLTGLPPTPLEVQSFLNDRSADAYGKVLDRLLASPRYGERMATFWLEAARYADTDGYQVDGGRTMWPWRDWVIKAFNENMPFDDFSVRQLAGDMLPGNDVQNVLASAFNRNHRINNEGGALPEEFIVEYAVDRVETTGTIWMGLTAGCARCHDHKYDPISHKEFFQLFAYFNSISERGKAAGKNAPPQISIGSPLQHPALLQQLVDLRADLTEAKKVFHSKHRQADWEKAKLEDFDSREPSLWDVGRVSEASATGETRLTALPDGTLVQSGDNETNTTYTVRFTPTSNNKKVAALRLEVLTDPKLTAPIRRAASINGNFVLSEVSLAIEDQHGKSTPVKLEKASHNFSQKGFSSANLIDGNPSTGWAASGVEPKLAAMTAVLSLNDAVSLPDRSQLVVTLSHTSQFRDHNIGRFRVSTTSSIPPDQEQPNLITALRIPAKERKPDQKTQVIKAFELTDPEVRRLTNQIASLRKNSSLTEVNVLVMKEADKPTTTYRLERGQYTSPDKSEVLTRGVPEALNENKPQPDNRLELARWLVSSSNPLGARVTVNRIWQQHFGIGIVETADNFGLQGNPPSHPDLLDWLAVDFMENGWDLKRLHKLLLSSATWMQSSIAEPAMFERDPENRLLARGPRFRLDASAIRDSALFASGLLNEELGGPPVKPYQPDGLWEMVAANKGTRYSRSNGSDLYRRGLYTYWKRAVNPPRMLIFDAATREYSTVARNATNTPLQALVLMNDVTFIESARALAERMIKEGGPNLEAKLIYGFRLAIGTHPSPAELAAMRTTFSEFRIMFKKDPKAAEEFLTNGESKRDPSIDPVNHAAMAAAAHLALNLDRAITLE